MMSVVTLAFATEGNIMAVIKGLLWQQKHKHNDSCKLTFSETILFLSKPCLE